MRCLRISLHTLDILNIKDVQYQGDPEEYIWSRKFGLEMSIGVDCRLTALCFADDVLLTGATEKELKEMMRDVIQAAACRGLAAHDDKSADQCRCDNNTPASIRTKHRGEDFQS